MSEKSIINIQGAGTKRNDIFNICLIVFMILLSIVMLYPYINVVAKAFNEGKDSMRGGITIYPRKPTLQNFNALLKDDVVINAVFISVARVIIGTILALIVQYSAAYTMKKKNLRGKIPILMFLMIPMFFGGGLIPTYVLYVKMHLFNNFLVYILPYAYNLFHMVIIRTYLSTIPDSFEESAMLDGANEITIMFRIMIPLSLPILATIALWMLVFHWNDWTTSLYFISKPKLYTMSFVLMKILRQYDDLRRMIRNSIEMGSKVVVEGGSIVATSEAIKAAQIVLTTIPIIITYPFLQKYFIKGIMIGAIKE